jgi:hypothetical protein
VRVLVDYRGRPILPVRAPQAACLARLAIFIPGHPGPSSKTKDNLMQRTTQAPLSLQMAKRCGAKTRRGKPRQSPVVRGRNRCRMQGGAKGSGAPSGERNGNYRHGLYTADAIAERKAVRAWLRSIRSVTR